MSCQSQSSWLAEWFLLWSAEAGRPSCVYGWDGAHLLCPLDIVLQFVCLYLVEAAVAFWSHMRWPRPFRFDRLVQAEVAYRWLSDWPQLTARSIHCRPDLIWPHVQKMHKHGWCTQKFISEKLHKIWFWFSYMFRLRTVAIFREPQHSRACGAMYHL